jgi:hypothetical protein
VAAKVARDLGLIPSHQHLSTEDDVEACSSSKGEEGFILTDMQLAALVDDQHAYRDAIDRKSLSVVADGVIEGRIT